MANFTLTRKVVKGRSFVTLAATPKSPETRKMLREFHAGVGQLEKNWKAHVAAKKKAAKTAKTAKKKKK
jgi:hypothetical protein